jgi:hypothetical protein
MFVPFQNGRDQLFKLLGDVRAMGTGGFNATVGGTTTPEQFDRMAACVEHNRAQLDAFLASIHTAPLASLALIESHEGQRRTFTYTCSDANGTKLTINDGDIYVYASGLAGQYSRDVKNVLVGYIDEKLRFRPIDLEALRGELPHAPELDSKVRDYDALTVQETLTVEEAFQSRMRTLLPTCKDTDGISFSKAYPIVQ